MAAVEEPPSGRWSPRAEIARSLALLPVSDAAGRATCASRLSSCCAPPANTFLDTILYRSGVVAAAAYLSRVALRLPEGRRLLDALAARCAAGDDGALRDEMRKVFLRDRALQLEIASEDVSSPARALMQELTAGGRPEAADPDEHPDLLIRRLLSGDDEGSSLRYTASFVDAVFFQANEVDTEVVHSLIRPAVVRKAGERGEGAEVQLADEDYYISAERPSIVTRIADATADASAADRIASQPGGLRAFRHLAESAVSSSGSRAEELFETEIARSIANIAAGSSDIVATAKTAADEGLLSLLSEWSDDSSRHVARGHLQVESNRALCNLSQALEPDEARRHFYVNGMLPLQPPSDACTGHADAPMWDTDVVFVHGLRGGPLLTWRIGDVKLDMLGKVMPVVVPTDVEGPVAELATLDASLQTDAPAIGRVVPSLFSPSKPANSKANEVEMEPAMTVWARDWLKEDAKNCRLLSVGHDAGVLRAGLGRGRLGPTLSDRAEDVSAALQKARVGEDGRRVVFVSHSYGGIIVKEALVRSPKLAERTRGVVFFGVPHFGSPVAGSWSGQSQFVLSQAVRELFPASDARLALDKLNHDFIQVIEARKRAGERVEVVSFGEGKRLKLEVGARTGQASIMLDLVPRESADPQTGQFWLIHDADHVQLSKPHKREDFRYRIVASILEGNRAHYDNP